MAVGNAGNGRPKGSLNKRSIILRKLLDARNVSVIDEILAVVDQLQPVQQAQVWLGLMPYLYPKLTAIHVTKSPEEEELESMPLEELKARARDVVLGVGDYERQIEGSSNSDTQSDRVEACASDGGPGEAPTSQREDLRERRAAEVRGDEAPRSGADSQREDEE